VLTILLAAALAELVVLAVEVVDVVAVTICYFTANYLMKLNKFN
jgi:hypothetical protein